MSKAHGKELNVLKSYRLNDFKKKAGATHVDMSSNIRRAAFTLAEVLITLGIIGVVAAMTIPTLIADYQEKQTVTQLTKAYSMLAQAAQLMQVEYGSISTWGMSKTNTGEIDEDTGEPILDYSAKNLLSTRLKKYLRVAKECTQGEVCLKNPVYYLNGTLYSEANFVETENAVSRFFLQDGTFVNIGWFQGTYTDIAIVLPIGNKDAVIGKNYFYFVLTDNGLFPKGMKVPAVGDTSTFENSCVLDAASNNINSGFGCTAWVIYNKNMDYLRCNDLSWDGKHKCDE